MNLATVVTFIKPHLASITYGGFDGIITTFAMVSGGEGASLEPTMLLILSFAALVADGLAMGIFLGNIRGSRSPSLPSR